MSSSDLPAPGRLTAGQSAVVQFDLRVNDGVPPGTVISNQALVDTAELPNLLTDGDGNPATGPEPTVVVVGNLQELRITKNVSVVGGGPALAGATLEYVVQVTNVGTLPAYAVVIRDDIAVPTPGYLTFVDQSWSLNGSTTGIAVVGSLLTADYSTTYGALQPGRDRDAALPRRARTRASRSARASRTPARSTGTTPAQTGERERLDRRRRHPGHRARQRHAPGTTRTSIACSTRTRARSRAGPSSCT